MSGINVKAPCFGAFDTAFVPRPLEFGPVDMTEEINMDFDIEAADFVALARAQR